MDVIHLSAEHAHEETVVLDNVGSIWVRLQSGEWSYISEGRISWDARAVLPEEYAPYRALDNASAEFIREAFRRRQGLVPDSLWVVTMDPDAALRELRAITKLVLGGRHMTAPQQRHWAELFEALDDWMSRDGFPPKDWRKPWRKP